MKTLDGFKLLGISALLVVGLAACDQKTGSAESAGKKIDQVADDAGKKMEETVDKVGEKMSIQSAKTEAAIDDIEITTMVKSAVFSEPGLKTLQISVDTEKGVVTLSGTVDSQPGSDKAKALAAGVPGVKEVINRLVIKSNG